MKLTGSLAITAVVAVVAISGLGHASRAAAAPTLEPIERYSDWLSARPTESDLRGKVVLVDIFTFACGNCQNVTPNLRALYREHRADLEIVGVHTPETSYETQRSNVVASLARQGIVWPVAVDNDHRLWNAYDTEYWPTQLIFDKHGVLRKTVIGDSQDKDVDRTISQLLAES